MAKRGLDALLPDELRAESPDERRRGRLVLYALAIALAVDVATVLAMPAVTWAEDRPRWLLFHILTHAPTLLVLRWTRSVSAAAHYFIAVVFAQAAYSYSGSHGLSAFAFIAIPVAAAHLIGARAAVAWTAAAIGATFALPLWLQADTPMRSMSIAISVVTFAIGVASGIVEATRARTARELSAAEGSARLQRERLRTFVEQTFPCIAETKDGTLLFVSDGVKELLGYTAAEVLPIGESLVRAEDVRILNQRVSVSPAGRVRAEARVRHRDGHWLWVEIFGIPMGERAGDGRWLFAARDIDDEVRRREQLEQTQRLEGIGVLAAGIAHDFNNLLTVITGFGSMLPQSETREQILSAADSAAELAGQLLAFGRSDPGADGLIAPANEIEALTPVIRSVLGEEVALSVDVNPSAMTVRIAPGRFKQVVLNLVTNAKEAMPRGGRLAVAVRPLALDAARAEELRLDAGPYAEIAIGDTGTGMSEEVRRRAFDPFFSTKEAHRGSGLGLASAYGIVRRCGGAILIDSAEGAGTTVRVLLPDAREPLRAAEDPPREPRATAGAAEVWVVEDDARIRNLMRTTLSQAGYVAHAAESGAAAIELLARTGRGPHLLVTDVVMPGMRGTDLAARLREASPQMRVLFVSGYSEFELGAWRAHEKGIAFLAKPFKQSQLASAVSDLLAG